VLVGAGVSVAVGSLVAVAVGEDSSRVGDAGAEGDSTPFASGCKLKGVAVEGVDDLPARVEKRIPQIPRIETMPMTIGIRSSRSNEGRGCMAEKVLPPFYLHFHQPGQS